MRTDITELVQGVGDLVTLPDIFTRINQLVESPDSTTADIAQAVSLLNTNSRGHFYLGERGHYYFALTEGDQGVEDV